MSSADQTFHPWTRLNDDVQNCVLDALTPMLPSVATRPTYGMDLPLYRLSRTSKEMNALVKKYVPSREVLLATGLEQPSVTASPEERAEWAKQMEGVRHIVFATGSEDPSDESRTSFAIGTELLMYLAANPEEHSVETITFDERIQDGTPNMDCDRGRGNLFHLTMAADAVLLSKPDASIQIQIHAHPHTPRPYSQYLLGDYMSGIVAGSGVSWGGADFSNVPKFNGRLRPAGNTSRRCNFDLTGRDAEAALTEFREWCLRQSTTMERAEKAAARDTAASYDLIVNLYAAKDSPDDDTTSSNDRDALSSSYWTRWMSYTRPTTVGTNRDVIELRDRFQAVVDTAGAKQPGGRRSTMTLNVGVCDQKAYIVDGNYD